ncbi:5-formyltetrahydrofolate cyclo-ligase [Euzebyella marina]|uniref:5-formyltetrahydrofolate cyclo-ligase n=1 Tax=Euzebyella marina TaxID=1761453 RepID=A0A3G2LB61_9FLAO|nr:5-formyltetrahydrofolate cyclo-ligase [Euzebyella marina]AYN69506.1 5-formyltetrahydrofolate cyclo-ligase [Euzebyella marina]
MQKKDLRSRYNALRNNLSDDALVNSSLSIANRALQLPTSVWKSDYYHLFLPIAEKKEIDTSFLLSILQGKDKHVVLPKVVDSENMIHFLLTDSTRLKKSKWSIPEPVDGIEIAPNKIDVVFVPLLAFDGQGQRVGYGKGFYDRFLAQCRKDTIKIGLSLFEAEERISDFEESDIPLDFCVTPKKVYSFSEV